ncbi:cytochrome P450 [Suillus lakei]|nr:cytochrome P450 [Suillus lakei]
MRRHPSVSRMHSSNYCNTPMSKRLREELFAFGGDPTYEHLKIDFPYLDAVVNETLRHHPPVPELTRLGSSISISIGASSRSYALWGPDAKQFKPDRWLTQVGISGKAEEIHDHRHLLILVDGPRTCLGKEFVVVELKMITTNDPKVSSILVKNFVFEMQDGSETQVEVAGGILPHPRMVGENSTRVPPTHPSV